MHITAFTHSGAGPCQCFTCNSKRAAFRTYPRIASHAASQAYHCARGAAISGSLSVSTIAAITLASPSAQPAFLFMLATLATFTACACAALLSHSRDYLRDYRTTRAAHRAHIRFMRNLHPSRVAYKRAYSRF